MGDNHSPTSVVTPIPRCCPPSRAVSLSASVKSPFGDGWPIREAVCSVAADLPVCRFPRADLEVCPHGAVIGVGEGKPRASLGGDSHAAPPSAGDTHPAVDLL